MTFGVRLGVHPDALKRAFDIWWEPTYSELRLEGNLGNALPGWGLLGVQADAEVLDPEATPYVVRTADERLAAVLNDEWPHDEVLSRLP